MQAGALVFLPLEGDQVLPGCMELPLPTTHPASSSRPRTDLALHCVRPPDQRRLRASVDGAARCAPGRIQVL